MELAHNITFVAEDPPRRSWFGLWDPVDQGGLLAGAEGCASAASSRHESGLVSVESTVESTVESSVEVSLEAAQLHLALPAKRGTTITGVAAQRLGMATAIDALGLLARSSSGSRSAHAWAGVIRVALAMIADGRVLPWVSPAGFDSWRVDPLGPSELELVRACATSLPPEAFAVPVPGRGRIADPEYVVRDLFDAVADTLFRTAAAHRIGSLTLFADQRPTRVRHLGPWVNELAAAHCADARLVIQAEPPRESEQPDHNDAGSIDSVGLDSDVLGNDVLNSREVAGSYWTLRFQLQSKADPSLVVDAADFWKAPSVVMERLGQQAEITLLAGLRRASLLVAPLAGILQQEAPVSAAIHDDEIDSLLDRLDDLADADVEVRWPSELVAPKIQRQLVVSAEPAPTGSLPNILNLEGLLTVDWEFLIDGLALTKDELDVLGDAKRAVVPLRGKWVQLDRRTREQLRARPPHLSAADLLRATREGSLDLRSLTSDSSSNFTGEDGGDTVEVRLVGAMVELAKCLEALTEDRRLDAPVGFGADLRPYQRRGLGWMSDLCSLGLGGCLADDMGLGKTVQLLALHALRPGRTVVVCPTSLLNNWRREAERFVPGVVVRTFHGPKRSLENLGDGDLVLTTYGVVRSDAELLGKYEWDLIVADEAQFIKNPNSHAARAIRKIPASARIALTGTPVENRLSELWAILDWTIPGILGPFATFKRQTATPIERDDDRRVAQRLHQLVKPFLLRRRKSDPGIAPELPPKIERDVIVPLTAEQVTLYKATVEHSLTEVAQAEGIARRGLVLKLLTGLKQIANHPAQFLGEAGPLPERSGKLEALRQLIETASQNGESTIVFTQYVKMGALIVDCLSSGGHEVAMLHGGQSVAARQVLVDRFQEKKLSVLVLSLKAGGTGLNLTTATNVVHYDRWWNPAVEDQATDRAYRIGQDQTVTVHRVITEGTIEDRVAELLNKKRELADRVVGGEAWIGDLTDDQLAELVTLEPTMAEAV